MVLSIGLVVSISSERTVLDQRLGQYLFRLADPNSSSKVVQVLNADGTVKIVERLAELELRGADVLSSRRWIFVVPEASTATTP